VRTDCLEDIGLGLIDILATGCELTGDTVQFGKGAWGDALNAQIMFVIPLHL
jgi:hypothetical protein